MFIKTIDIVGFKSTNIGLPFKQRLGAQLNVTWHRSQGTFSSCFLAVKARDHSSADVASFSLSILKKSFFISNLFDFLKILRTASSGRKSFGRQTFRRRRRRKKRNVIQQAVDQKSRSRTVIALSIKH